MKTARVSPVSPASGPGGAEGPKLASRVATRIVADVARRGWPVGEVVGSEAELLERYGVSRAVLREAVRLVEHQHVARMRPGPGGGLIVSEPNVEAIIDAAVIYLLRVQAPLDDVFAARLTLEEIVTRLAPQRANAADRERVRQLVEAEAAGLATDHRALHSLLASITRNPALELFVDILNRLTLFYFSDQRSLSAPVFDASLHAHRRIAQAVVAGDDDLARARMTKHLRAEADFIRERPGARQVLKPSAAIHGPPGAKRAESVAREMFGRVLLEKLPAGTQLGSEAELMQRHDVSRAVLREAVRVLEHHHIAFMRRGPGGGLFVASPSVAAVSTVVASYLVRMGTRASHLAELRVGVENARVEDNRALELVADVAARLSQDHAVSHLEQATRA